MSTIPPGVTPSPMPLANSGQDALSPGMLEALRGTRPWVRFLSILGFIASACMVLAGLFMGVLGGFMPGSGLGGPIVGAAMGFVYVLLAFIYVFPSLFLLRYARAIGTALTAPAKTAPVEEALRQQKSFWKFVGVFAVIWIVVVVIVLVAGVVISILSVAG